MLTNNIYIPHFIIALREIAINPQTMSDVYRATHITYSHLHDMKKEFLSRGWVTAEKGEARAIILTITERGMNIVKSGQSLMDAMGVSGQDVIDYLARSKRLGKTNEDSKDLQFVH